MMNPHSKSTRRGIALAGGSGSRMAPITRAVNKHLVPVFDRPLVYFPLATLMSTGIRQILLIAGEADLPAFRRLLGTGAQWGICLDYAVQERPAGIADALRIARGFLAGGPSALILGDNIFMGSGLRVALQRADARQTGATIFAIPVANPRDLGIVELDETGQPISLEEKPQQPRSNYAVPGLYFYDATAPDRADRLRPSQRGELEITDLNRAYLGEKQLHVEVSDRGIYWTDGGTPPSLMRASRHVEDQIRLGRSPGCVEEIAWRNGWITTVELTALAAEQTGNYGALLQRFAKRAGELESESDNEIVLLEGNPFDVHSL